MWCDEKVRFLLLTNANKPSHNGFSSLTVVYVLTLCATESRVKFKIQCISTIIQCFISIFPLIFLWNHNKLYTVTFSLFLFSFEKRICFPQYWVLFSQMVHLLQLSTKNNYLAFGWHTIYRGLHFISIISPMWTLIYQNTFNGFPETRISKRLTK